VKRSDLTILCVGLNSRLEGEESRLVVPGFEGGDRTDIRLPEPQRKLMDSIFETGKPVVLVLTTGSAVAIQPAQDRAQAIIEAWYAGEAAGTAIAETLSGNNNPAGRLPITFYASLDDLPPFTDYSMKNRTYRYFTGKPLYPFGFGLSYSQFEYSSPVTSGTVVTTEVTNTSDRPGDEVVQLYTTNPDGSNPQLRGFKRIHLNAGEKQSVRFDVKPSDLKGRKVSIGGGQPMRT
jgi:beta-glucosidase